MRDDLKIMRRELLEVTKMDMGMGVDPLPLPTTRSPEEDRDGVGDGGRASGRSQSRQVDTLIKYSLWPSVQGLF